MRCSRPYLQATAHQLTHHMARSSLLIRPCRRPVREAHTRPRCARPQSPKSHSSAGGSHHPALRPWPPPVHRWGSRRRGLHRPRTRPGTTSSDPNSPRMSATAGPAPFLQLAAPRGLST
ncbi:hypothetical protein NDU88_005518 [Pleurodeles waltl]|uniref:Uncharacterized protein n=1 Tax=Pleurodeles waltl TaxID=8319 RepID=A0AAV7WYH6_PLEWA|nr:hypothetical protein NDU88_005518 [Pleurodeles waltl]